MAHGINANLVHGWRELARRTVAAIAPVRFVPVTVAPATMPAAGEPAIEVELRCVSIVV